MTTNTKVYNIAEKYLGKKCYDAINYCGLSASASWCDAFVTYSFYKAGAKNLYCNGRKETYCPHSIEWCRAYLAEIPLFLAMKGDIIFFDWEPNGNPNHIGFVKGRKSTSEIYTLEGNTSGGIVATKTRPAKYVQAIFRPHYTASYKIGTLSEDGKCGYSTIANLQKALGLKVTGILTKETIKALQKKVGASADGAFGKTTAKKTQTFLKKAGCYTGKIDSDFGPASVRGLQKWINKQNKTTAAETKPVETPVTKPTETVSKTPKADKIVASIKKLAWPEGTAKKKWRYSTGSPTSEMKTAMKKRGYSGKVSFSDCGYCVNTVIYDALGIKIKALAGNKDPFPKLENFKVVYSGKKIVKGVLKPGDIIRYKKRSGSQHTLLYYGNNNWAEGGRKCRFFVIRHFPYLSKAKFNKSSVKTNTLQVLRIKE